MSLKSKTLLAIGDLRPWRIFPQTPTVDFASLTSDAWQRAGTHDTLRRRWNSWYRGCRGCIHDNGWRRLLAEKCGGLVAERVDTAVHLHQRESTLIMPTAEVDAPSNVADESLDLNRSHAQHESAAYHQWCDNCVPTNCVYHRTGNGTHLKRINCRYDH